MPSLSVIIPLFNERESLPELSKQLFAALSDEKLHGCFPSPFSFEIIMVDDGSTDDSAGFIREMIIERPEIRLISFRRNYGKTAALSAGFKASSGDIVITMDADLQDDPEEFTQLVLSLQNGSDLVSGWKKQRNDPLTKTLPSKFFNWFTRLVTDIQLHDFNCGLKAYRRELVDQLELHGDMHRYIPVLAQWSGFRVTEIAVKHHERRFGKSKFGTARFFAGFFDFLAVMFITRYLRRPMHFFGMMGMFSFFAGFLINLYITLDKILNQKPVSNRPILFLGMLLIILGVQFFSTGLLGEMLSTPSTRGGSFTIRETVNIPVKALDRLAE